MTNKYAFIDVFTLWEYLMTYNNMYGYIVSLCSWLHILLPCISIIILSEVNNQAVEYAHIWKNSLRMKQFADMTNSIMLVLVDNLFI